MVVEIQVTAAPEALDTAAVVPDMVLAADLPGMVLAADLPDMALAADLAQAMARQIPATDKPTPEATELLIPDTVKPTLGMARTLDMELHPTLAMARQVAAMVKPMPDTAKPTPGMALTRAMARVPAMVRILVMGLILGMVEIQVMRHLVKLADMALVTQVTVQLTPVMDQVQARTETPALLDMGLAIVVMVAIVDMVLPDLVMGQVEPIIQVDIPVKAKSHQALPKTM